MTFEYKIIHRADEKMLNQLGNERWEVVSIEWDDVMDSRTPIKRACLKRPI